MWGYQTTTNATGAVLTSPVLSLDGTKVAYVESTSTGPILHVLKWKAGQGNSGTPPTIPIVPDVSTSSVLDWQTCVADSSKSCVFNLPYGTVGNTRSSPFYKYCQPLQVGGCDEL